MSDSYCSKLRTYESLPSIAEPLEVIVIFDLSEHGFRLDRSPASFYKLKMLAHRAYIEVELLVIEHILD